MKVLITGASGFLGRRVVDAFLARGVAVRAMVRPATDVGRLGWPDSVEIVRHDLRSRAPLKDAFEGIDALVHLAACVGGDDDETPSRWTEVAFRRGVELSLPGVRLSGDDLLVRIRLEQGQPARYELSARSPVQVELREDQHTSWTLSAAALSGHFLPGRPAIGR